MTITGQVPAGIPSEWVTVRPASGAQLSETATPKASKAVTEITAAGRSVTEHPSTVVAGNEPEMAGTVVSSMLKVWSTVFSFQHGSVMV